MEKKRARWRDEEEDAVVADRRRHEKEKKKKAKLERIGRERNGEQTTTTTTPDGKRRVLHGTVAEIDLTSSGLLRFTGPEIRSCRSVENYERLNHIEEGAYGVVFRGRDVSTGEIVALKKLKVDKDQHGFPITSLREIEALMELSHPNIVNLKEVVIGGALDQIYIVMEFVEHDLKSLMTDMREPFLQSEVKTILHQLLSATAHMHENWIIHRDLKTSNLLMNNKGMIKVADFGLARYFSEPAAPMTPLVVTLWYRAPEILLGAKQYSTEVDMWSIGCIFGELLINKPLIEGKSEINQIMKIFELLGYPDESSWPGFRSLPNAKSINIPKDRKPKTSLRSRFPYITSAGVDLLSSLLQFDPKKRITAKEALEHPYFKEEPMPKPPEAFPSFPSKAGEERKRKAPSPRAPVAVHGFEVSDSKLLGFSDDENDNMPILASPSSSLFRDNEQLGAGFQLRFG
ncbi:kinase-like domain-containing protein [Lipomyces tetrasporus]|uniref:Kinase-like domain-containing protein n=1 Tax=Lipomyces tetrasporus TaxID=54092 RepID=A0AAD7QW84_9ASCO|nr:kinase-like domain-containing protein [Lipomyces tetrasporus]KAJ8102672.1 kinase-like domain-containing protein [Lipomyces tetrasporus]